MEIKIKLSDRHYLLDGLVYSADCVSTADSPLAVLSSLAVGDYERAQFIKKFNLILPGTSGAIVGTTSVNGNPRFRVKFDGSSNEVIIAGKFIHRQE